MALGTDDECSFIRKVYKRGVAAILWQLSCAIACFYLMLGFSVDGAMAGGTYEFPGPANGFFNGNDVYEWCKADRSMALAYTAGLWDLSSRSVLIIDGIHGPEKNPDTDFANHAVDFALDRLGRICEPNGVTLNQVTDVFCAYLRDTPKDRHTSTGILFSEALTKAWPCKKP